MAVAWVTINQVLLTTKSYLMRWLRLPRERVLVVADWKPYQTIQADTVVEIRPGSSTRPAWWSDGHSRISSWHSAQVEIRVRTRLALDTASEDELWLTDPSLGHERTVHAVEDAMDDWVPLWSGAAMTIQPVKHLGTGAPTKADRSPGWGDSILTFQVDYQAQRTGSIRAGQ